MTAPDKDQASKREGKCDKCGKQRVAPEKQGSLTSYIFQAFACTCDILAPEAGRPAAANKSDKKQFCQRCGLLRRGDSRIGTITGYLLQDLKCRCPAAENFDSATMSRRFWKLKNKLGSTSFRTALAEEGKKVSLVDLAPGTTVAGVYAIESLIGRGGMGEVYRARHMTLGKEIALKVIPPEQVTEVGWQRFQAEARLFSRVSHANLVQVTDLGIHEGCLPFFAMDFVNGQTLADFVASQGPLTTDQAVQIFSQVCDGVGFAHQHGVIHRDLKPANIMLEHTKSPRLSVKVLDFGLAKLTQHDRQKQSLTAVGEVFGSPFYMSPEQCQGETLDARSDLYSIGCTLFEALTGQPPFTGNISYAIMNGHMFTPPPTLESIAGPGVFSGSMEMLVAKLLHKEREQRYQSMMALKNDLERVGRGLSIAPHSTGGDRAQSQRLQTAQKSLPEEEPPATGLEGLNKVAIIAAILAVFVLAGSAFFLTNSQKNKIEPHADASYGFLDASDTNIVHVDGPIRKFLVSTTASEKIFAFPKEPIGLLKLGDMEKETKEELEVNPLIIARDRVTVPKDALLNFRADQAISLQPELLAGFDPDTLYGLSFMPGWNWNDRHIKMACRLTGLKSLDVTSCSTGVEGISDISKLQKLRSLYFSANGSDSSLWCSLPQLENIKSLKAQDMTNSSSLLRLLKRNKQITSLILYHCDISDTGMTSIGCLKTLETLNLYGGKVTNKGLKVLKSLPNIKTLVLHQPLITPPIIDSLLALPKLQNLDIETGAWGFRDQAKLDRGMRLKHVTLKQYTSQK